MKTRFNLIALGLMALAVGACSSNPKPTPQAKSEPNALPILRETGLLDSPEEKAAKSAKQERAGRHDRLMAGTPLQRLAALSEKANEKEGELLAKLAVEDAAERSQRWLTAALTMLARGNRMLFQELASDALEMQVESIASSGSLRMSDGIELDWRVASNVSLFGNPEYDVPSHDFAAPILGVDDGRARKPWLGFAKGYLAAEAQLSKEALIVEGPLATLVVDYAENLRSLNKLIERERDAALHFQISVQIISIGKSRMALPEALTGIDSLRALSAAQVEEINALTKNEARARRIAAPRLTVLPGQLANISIVNEIAFIENFVREETEVNGERVVVADPKIGIVRDGMTIETRIAEIDAEHVYGMVTIELANVLRPIPVFETRGLGETPMSIQIPEVRHSAESTTQKLKVGTTYVTPALQTLQEDEQGKSAMVPAFALITIERVLARDKE